MASMMNIKYMTSMKCMKLTAYFSTYIQCKSYVIFYFFLPFIVIIPSYIPTEGCHNDSTVIAT